MQKKFGFLFFAAASLAALIGAMGAAVSQFWGCCHKCDTSGCHNHCCRPFGHRGNNHLCKRHGGA